MTNTYMHRNPNHSAPRNSQTQIVARDVEYHQAAAMRAARMIAHQYTRETKNKFKRECLDHLMASVSGCGVSV